MDSDRTGIYSVTPSSDGMRIILGKERITRDFFDYLRDESSVTGKNVEALFFPKSIENIVYVVNEARSRGKTLTISGGRTGICAGAVPYGGYLLSLDRMKRVLDLKPCTDGYELKVESGLRLNELVNWLKENANRFQKGWYFYPPDPTETSATIGGTVATNASGARTLFFGPTRDYVLALEVVLSTGELLKVRRGDVREKGGFFEIPREKGNPLIVPVPDYDIPKVKHAAGLYSSGSMDLIDLFIGSEGILGIVATVTVRLIEELFSIIGGVAFFHAEEDALDFVFSARGGEVKPLVLEYLDNNSLILLEETRREQGPISEIPEVPSSNSAVYFELSFSKNENIKDILINWKNLIEESHGDPSSTWGAMNKRDLLRLKAFRHSLPESINKRVAQNKSKDERLHKVGTDMAVPDEMLKEMMNYYKALLDKENLRYAIFGHIGNNHLHVNMIPDNYSQLERAKELYTLFAKKAVSMGGTVSAEHGIGKLKKDYLRIQFSDKVLEQMRRIKLALDPYNIFNPGDMI